MGLTKLIGDTIRFVLVDGFQPRARLTGYIKPQVLDHYQDECGDWHTHVRARHPDHVAQLYEGTTLQGDASRVIRKVGNNAYEVSTQKWNTNTDYRKMNPEEKKAYQEQLNRERGGW